MGRSRGTRREMEARAAGGLAENSFLCALPPPLARKLALSEVDLQGQSWGKIRRRGEQAPRGERGLPAASVVGLRHPRKSN